MDKKLTFQSSIIANIHKLSRDFIDKHYKVESIYFDTIWEIYESELRKRINKPPEKWRSKILRHKLMGALGFTDVSQALDLVTPAIITTLSATMIAIRDLGYIPRDEEVHKIIDKYAPAFGARGVLVNLMKRYLKDLCEILPEILEEKKEKKEFVPSTISKVDSFARVWTLKTKDPENGEIISKKRYEEIIEDEEIPLLIIKEGGLKNIYVNENNKTLSYLIYDLLEFVLKHRGNGGDALNLLENVWKFKNIADYRKKLEIAKKRGDEKTVKREIDEMTWRVRKAVTELNGFLKSNFNIGLKTYKKGAYILSGILKYYLIEKI